MKQKTPLQQAIQRIEADAKYKPIQYQLASEQAIAILMDLLATERKVIESAYDAGVLVEQRLNNGCDYICQSDYFTSKFEQ